MTITDAETDQRIIKAIQQGNHDAFAALYDRHSSWLMAVAYRILQNKQDAEDLLHDLFLEIWRKAASYNPERGTVTSWLAVKVRSRALDRLRALSTVKKRTVEQSPTEMEFAGSANELCNAVDHVQARKMLEQLTPVQRTVIELSYFRGFTCQEIANNCHIPLGTVKSGLQRAIHVLRQKFNSCGVSDTCQ